MARIMKIIAKWVLVVGVLIGVPGAIWGQDIYGWFMARGGQNGSDTHQQFHIVRRGPLPITLTEGGQLRAVKQYNIGTELDRAKIAWVVAEGKQVCTGEKLIEFERQPTVDAIKLKESDLENFKHQLVVAQENIKIEASSGRSLVAAAETRLADAQKDLKTFREIESPKRFRDLEAATATARKGLAAAKTALIDTQTKADEEISGDEAEQAALDKGVQSAKDCVTSANASVGGAVLAHKMFKTYDYPQKLKASEQAVVNAQLDLAKARVAAQSSLLQKQQEMGRISDQMKRVATDLEKFRLDLTRCCTTAPAAGMVLYGDPGSAGRNYYNGNNNQPEAKVGAEWWKGSTILNIPDFSAFEIDISISEEYRGRIKAGCKVLVTIEAIPGLQLEGMLKEISLLAQPRVRWDETSPKAFSGIITLKNADSRMVSGMSARAQIQAETIENALQVPIEAVFNVDGKPVCYVRQDDKIDARCVTTGKSNDDFVEIPAGLQEGEEICLFKPQMQQQQAQPKQQAQSQPHSQPQSQPQSLPTTTP